MKKYKFTIVCILALMLCGCADNVQMVTETETCVHIYGFWGGVWHGLIAPFDFVGMLIWDAPFDFVGMLIWDDVSMYAPSNNGGWYAFGFLLGSGGLGFLAGKKS